MLTIQQKIYSALFSKCRTYSYIVTLPLRSIYPSIFYILFFIFWGRCPLFRTTINVYILLYIRYGGGPFYLLQSLLLLLLLPLFIGGWINAAVAALLMLRLSCCCCSAAVLMLLLLILGRTIVCSAVLPSPGLELCAASYCSWCR